MAKYCIEDIKGVRLNGSDSYSTLACEVKVKDSNGNCFFIFLVDDMIPEIYKTEISVIDAFIKEYQSCQGYEVENYLGNHFIVSGDYESILEETDSEYYDIFRYLFYAVKAEKKQATEFVKSSVGKYLDEIDIPNFDFWKPDSIE